MGSEIQAWVLPPRGAAAESREGLSVASVLGVLRRRRRVFLLPALALALLGAAAAMILPSRYRSEAVLTVEPVVAREDEHLASPELDAARQVSRITEIVHRRALLERVAGEFELFDDRSGPLGEAELKLLRTQVQPRVEGPRTFSLGFESDSPARAQAVAARIAELLISASQAEREQRARATVGFIEEQIDLVSSRLAESERQIESYKRAAFEELPEQVPSLLDHLREIDDQLNDLAAGVAGLESRRAAIQSQLRQLELQGFSRDPSQLRADGLRGELAALRRRYTEEHPEVRRVRAELDAAESSVGGQATPSTTYEMSPARLRYLGLAGELQETQDLLARSAVRRRSLAAQAALYRSRLESAPRHEMAVAALTREYEAEKSQYERLLAEISDARMEERLEAATQGVFRVVEAPRVPLEPFAPHRLRIALLGLLAGLGVGIAAAFLSEQGDTSFANVEDLDLPSSLPVLAAIPRLTAKNAVRSDLPGLVPRGVSLLEDPFGPASEQYRILAAKLVSRNGNGSSNRHGSLLVTSAGAGEGKTTTAVNVALALAKMMRDESVLLVDADLGRPAVHRLLDLSPAPGLAELLAQPDADPAGFVRNLRGLSVMTAGEYSPETRASLGSPLAQHVLRRLRQRFAYVIVDAPPILAVAEGFILQQVVESVLLVVRARVTPRELVRRSIASLDISRLIGVVMTDVEGIAEAYTYPYFDPSRRAAAARAEEASPW
jgi:polysaccharide chain length determinant protein (PEP-CTERM system associated)